MEMESGQKHPIGMYMLSITALFQNFGFWGVVSFFPLYLTGEYQYSEADSTIAYGVFLGVATALPLLGGYASAYVKQYSSSMPGGRVRTVVLEHIIFAPFSLGSVSLGYGFFWPAAIALQGRLFDSLES